MLHLGDCLEVMKTMPDNSVDLVLTDPPYGLAFMGKKWDCEVPSVEVWAEALRVLKPGGHLLAFAGTRTQHRMACRIEDAGFEIRDMLAWVYGSGFPKSLDVSKAIDKAAGAEREVVGVSRRHGGGNKPFEGQGATGFATNLKPPITAPATDAAREWDGWGTALKPALEPITMARKPLIGTVAANVLEHGTGALNVDECRVGTESREYKSTGVVGAGRERQCNVYDRGDGKTPDGRDFKKILQRQAKYKENASTKQVTGRWPANLLHDGSDEVVEMFPQTKSGAVCDHHVRNTAGGNGLTHGKMNGVNGPIRPSDSGSAARFFASFPLDDECCRIKYCAKASRRERGEGNTHATVKPIALMEYLVKLASRPDAVVLDPFMGSGTTGIACANLGRKFIGIEREPEYFKIAEARIDNATSLF